MEISNGGFPSTDVSGVEQTSGAMKGGRERKREAGGEGGFSVLSIESLETSRFFYWFSIDLAPLTSVSPFDRSGQSKS